MNSEQQTFDEGAFGEGRSTSGAAQDPYLGIGKEEYEDLGMGMGAYQLFGSPETIADQLIDLYGAGVGQVALSFLDPHHGVRQMGERIIPLLRERGYHQS
ncbi:MAG: hypothetical protein QM638_22670 [Nocardioides sp.]|uniref:hypothetical protein n=1 Tax=Nocardioides sp. TaxID=35761 RepID=UPI0039E275B3